MKKQPIIYIILILLFSSCLHKKYNQQKNELITEHTRMEAKEFSLSIVNAYFKEDCEKFSKILSDTIMLMDGDGIFETKGKEDKLCNSIKRAIRDKEKTMEDYLKMYKIEMFNQEELENRFNQKLPNYFQTTDLDYFFIGVELNENVIENNDFIWDDMFVFMVRKENGQWKLKGISG